MVRQGGGGGLFWFIVYVFFGAYFINAPFNFLKIPATSFDKIDPWLTLIGGILILIGGINHFRASRNRYYPR